MTHTFKPNKVRVIRTDRWEDVFNSGKHLFRPSVNDLVTEIKDAENKGIKTIYIHSKVMPEGR